jgi:hypothetical protein
VGPYEHAAYLSAHAIRAARSEVGESHEIVVPCRADAVLVREVESVEGGAERGDVGCRIEDFDLCS